MQRNVWGDYETWSVALWIVIATAVVAWFVSGVLRLLYPWVSYGWVCWFERLVHDGTC